MTLARPRVFDPPWRGRWPCPENPDIHAVLPDKNGNVSFHYVTPGGYGGVCPGVGKDFNDRGNA